MSDQEAVETIRKTEMGKAVKILADIVLFHIPKNVHRAGNSYANLKDKQLFL